MKSTSYVVFIVIILCHSGENSNNEDSNEEDDVFVATNDWQIVQKGQKIPQGLYVRMNLETGQIEAKLLGDTSHKSKALTEIPTDSDEEESLKFSEKELKEALKNIKDEGKPQEESGRKLKNEFRSYEELKRDLSDINLVPKSDAEILKELVKKYKKVFKAREFDEPHLLAILEDIEFLVHQYDNANEFVSLNGFNDIIYKNLNSSSSEIKRESLKLLGASVQNNAKVQIHALETGSIGFLLRILALDSDYSIKNRALFALGSLMRRFPLAQLKFIENAGLNVFTELLDKSVNIKLQLKIVTLVNDLILEYEYAVEDGNYTEKMRQYKQVNVKKKLIECDWCNHLNNILRNVITVDDDDHDSIEKCLNAILSVLDICDSTSGESLKKLVHQLHTRYKTLALYDSKEANDTEIDPDYYNHLIKLCNQITTYLNKKYKLEL